MTTRSIYVIFFVLFLPALTYAQAPDTIAIRAEVDSLFKLIDQFRNQRQFDQSMALIGEAQEKVFSVFGKNSVLGADALSKEGDVLKAKRENAKAESVYEEAASIYKKRLGPTAIKYGKSLNQLALIESSMGKFKQSEEYHLAALAIWQSNYGPDHEFCAASLINLGGIVYFNSGRYEEGLKMLEKAKVILEQTPEGENHRFYTSCIDNLANIYKTIGQLKQAETLTLKSVDILAQQFGKEHPNYAATLINLGSLYLDLYQLEKIEPIYQEVQSILENINFPKNHPLYFYLMNNWGVAYRGLGQYEKAENIYLELLKVWEADVGKSHMNYVGPLVNLGALYEKQGKLEEAKTRLLEAKNLFEQFDGPPTHEFYGKCLGNLAGVYYALADHKQALNYYQETRSFLEKTKGKKNKDYSNSLSDLGMVFRSMGELEKAAHHTVEANQIKKSILSDAAYHLSEGEMRNYISLLEKDLDKLYSLALKYPEVSSSCYDMAVFYKGFLLNSSQKLRRSANQDSISRTLFQTLKSQHRLLAREYSKPLDQRTNIEALEKAVNQTEKDLARRVSAFADATKQFEWTAIREHLDEGEIAIELIDFAYLNPKATDSVMYVALVLSNTMESPAFIPLFEEKQLQQITAKGGKRRINHLNELYGHPTPGSLSLYQLIWEPLQPYLDGAKTIYYAPSGLLNRINLGAIAVDDKQTIGDQFTLLAMGSTRKLAQVNQKYSGPQTAALFGGIKYEGDSTAITPVPREFSNEMLATRGSLDFSMLDTTTRGTSWKYLPYTKEEVQAIERILSNHSILVQKREGYDATEEQFKILGSLSEAPTILHVATHGFFFPDPQKKKRRAFSSTEEPAFLVSEHPMIRSGLLMAGGNYAWNEGKPLKEGMEDGILTAYEISQLDLSKTELVVLSACETGLGDINGNEGVYGLQRAFKIAGANYLIMSLWKVPDQQTQELMTAFYSNWLEEKLTIPEAFRKAQQTIRDKYEQPYYWAGFVLVR